MHARANAYTHTHTHTCARTHARTHTHTHTHTHTQSLTPLCLPLLIGLQRQHYHQPHGCFPGRLWPRNSFSRNHGLQRNSGLEDLQLHPAFRGRTLRPDPFNIQPAFLYKSPRLQDVCSSICKRRRRWQGHPHERLLCSDEGRIRRASQLALSIASHGHFSGPINRKTPYLQHVLARSPTSEMNLAFGCPFLIPLESLYASPHFTDQCWRSLHLHWGGHVRFGKLLKTIRLKSHPTSMSVTVSSLFAIGWRAKKQK